MKTESVLDVAVSYFESYSSTKGVDVKLLSILNTQRHKNAVENIRLLKSKSEMDQKKKLLPAFTPSGVFKSRNDSGLIRHSGLIAIDIDLKENEHIDNFHALKKELSNVGNIAYCGFSVSGKGYWALIPIAEPSLHKQHFKVIVKEFKDKGLTIDPSGCNLSRLRGVSYDSEAYFNHNAIPHKLPYPTYDNQIKEPVFKIKSDTPENVITLVKQIQKTGRDITRGYENWFAIGCSLANEFGENARCYFHEVSKNHPAYNVNDTDLQFDKCLKHRYNYKIETFFYHCANFDLRYKKVG